MRTVPVSPQSAEITTLLAQARDEDLILQAADGSEFVLSAVDDFDYEVARTRQHAELMAYLDDVVKRAKKRGDGISLDEARRQLGLD